MKIALGTGSEPKRKFLEETLAEIGLTAEVEAIIVESGVSEQPITSKETKNGSINRAKQAFKKSPTANFGLGIEVGYHVNKDGNYEMFCWSTIITPDKRTISTQSHKILLPKFHQEILKNNQYLGDYVQKYLELFPDLASQHLGNIIRHRKPLIQTAIKSSLLQLLAK